MTETNYYLVETATDEVLFPNDREAAMEYARQNPGASTSLIGDDEVEAFFQRMADRKAQEWAA